VARVVTLNLWGIRGNWLSRRQVLVDGLRKLRPGPDYHVAHQTEREPDGQGASIASRWPISALSRRSPRPSRAPRSSSSTTWPSWQLQFERERELQALAAARFVQSSQAAGTSCSPATSRPTRTRPASAS
jgi:hypothetical protein